MVYGNCLPATSHMFIGRKRRSLIEARLFFVFDSTACTLSFWATEQEARSQSFETRRGMIVVTRAAASRSAQAQRAKAAADASSSFKRSSFERRRRRRSSQRKGQCVM